MTLLRIQKCSCFVLVAALIGGCNLKDKDAGYKTNAKVTADLVIENARIFTSNSASPWAEALVVKDNKFVYVGNQQGLSNYHSSNTVDLGGKLLLPGLVDGHAHPGYVNVEDFGYVEGDTQEQLLESVVAYANNHPNKKWLRLCCWPTKMFVNGTQGPRKEVLDALLPDRLVWFESETAHDYWLNSKALREIGVTKNTPDPRSGLAMYARDEHGEPSGWIKEGAGVQHFSKHFVLIDKTHVELHKRSVAQTLQTFSKHGITALFDAGNKGFGDHVYSVIAQLEKEGRLPLRYFGTYQIFTPERASIAISEVKRYREVYGSDLLQFNSVKIFMDGISANQSAAFLKPYQGSNKKTSPLLSVTELRDLLLELHEEKLDLMVHSIGDLTTRTVLDAVEAAQSIVGSGFYPRVTLAHLALVHPQDIPRIAELDIIANFSPWWFGAYPNEVTEELLGAERYSRMYQAKTVFDSGAKTTFSSDEWWGGEMLATYISPYLGMQVGHTRQNPKDWWYTDDDGIRAPENERLSLQQLLQGYTQNGAYQLRLEDVLGSIEEGKLADFVVLDANIFEITPEDIRRTQPQAVFMNGRLIQGGL